MNENPPTLEELAAELESVADKLRSDAIDSDEAADLVERCAELAQQIARRDRRAHPRGRRGRGPGTPALSSTDAAAYPVELQQQVETYLEGLSFAAERGTARLDEAMRYSLLAGGKRIRPVLALATASALGRPPASVLPLAAALEMIHTYSLIHDDLPAMDDDDLRRGKPTCHVAYGEDVAILAGDGLFAEALRLVLSEQEGEPAGVLAAVREIVTAAGTGGMVGGQYLDVAGDVGGRPASRARAEDRGADRGVGRLGAGARTCGGTCHNPLPALRGRARSRVPDRRRHPRRDG